ncbi:hypothetical protein DFJ73DRAFT_842329 [Zopfochytrium polystomum]|nr:hypothetical protein DFJ73DRAFT_842329 [Zopfochytrium polystomum]
MSALASTVAAALGTGIDQDFENGIRILREAHSKKIGMRDSELAQLRLDLSRKEAENKELVNRIAQLEGQLSRSEKRITEMSRVVSKLASFKQSVMESLANDDELEEIRGVVAAGSSAAARGSTSSPLFGTSASRGDAFNLDAVGVGLENFTGERTTRLSFSSHTGSQGPPSPDRHTEDFLGAFQQTSTQRTGKQQFPPDAGARQPRQSQTVATPSPTPAAATLGGVVGSTANGSQSSASSAMANGRSRQGGSTAPDTLDADVNFTPYFRVSDPMLSGPGSAQHQAIPSSSSSQPPALQPQPPTKSVTFERRGDGTVGDAASGGSVDGREFFKRARATLSYDEFTTLLSNVKSYNTKDQSRQRTLDNLQHLLGERHRDLYDQFERLLAR